MIAILTKFVPLRDWAYAAAAIAAVIWYNVHVHGLEVSYAEKQTAAVVRAVKEASDKAQAEALKQVNALNAQYSARYAALEKTYVEQTQADAATHASDLQRLRQLAATSNQHPNPVLQGSGGAGTPPNTGESSLVGLGYVSAELAAALYDARDDLGKCYAERDTLTGK
jgi:hypothetical protein